MFTAIFKKKWLVSLRIEIILNITILMGAALLGGGLLVMLASEKALLTQRSLGFSESLSVLLLSVAEDQTGRPLNMADLVALVEKKLKQFPESMSLDNWGFVDRDLILIGSPHMVGALHLDMATLKRVSATMAAVSETRLKSSWFGMGNDDEGSATVTVPLIQKGQFVGALQAQFSLGGLAKPIGQVRRLLIVYAGFYGVIFILFGSFLLNRTLVRPIRRLMISAQMVAEGEFGQSVRISGPGEIVQLGRAFNRMIVSLREGREETELALASLQATNNELKKTQKELVRSEKMASVGHLAAGMAHEIGNPLGAVVGYLEMLKDGLVEAEDKDCIVRSLAEVGRIDRLVRELLDYATPEPLAEQRCDPAQVLRDSINILRHQGVLEGMELIFSSVSETLPFVAISAGKLQQVFINLTVNACDACDRRGQLIFEAENCAGYVQMSLTDQGPGMTPDVQGNLFDPFFTTKAQGEGRGLGLFVCGQIVADAGGRIEVESVEGNGTTFVLTLPKIEGCEDAEIS